MGLLSSRLDLQNSNYILVLHALEILANETSEPLSMASAFLYNHDFYEEVPTFRKTDTGKIIYDDDGYGGVFNKTWEILGYFDKANPHHFYESGYRESYWLKSDFFNFLIENEITRIPSVINWLASNPSEPQASEIKPQTTLLQRDPFLTNLDIFSVTEASCLISGNDPIKISFCRGDTNFWQNHSDYLGAENFINAGIRSGNLDHDITRQSLQKFLLDKGYFIKGFNDNLPPITADKVGQPTITQTPPTDPELSQQIADLNAQLASLKADNDRLTVENQQQADTIQRLNTELVAGKSDTPADDKPLQDNDLLTAIYDDTQPHLYAPELHNAIKVWKQIYHDNLTSQHLTTHSDKFDSAITQLNLRFANNAPKERLKQVTTPQQQKEKTKSKNS